MFNDLKTPAGSESQFLRPHLSALTERKLIMVVRAPTPALPRIFTTLQPLIAGPSGGVGVGGGGEREEERERQRTRKLLGTDVSDPDSSP